MATLALIDNVALGQWFASALLWAAQVLSGQLALQQIGWYAGLRKSRGALLKGEKDQKSQKNMLGSKYFYSIISVNW